MAAQLPPSDLFCFAAARFSLRRSFSVFCAGFFASCFGLPSTLHLSSHSPAFADDRQARSVWHRSSHGWLSPTAGMPVAVSAGALWRRDRASGGASAEMPAARSTTPRSPTRPRPGRAPAGPDPAARAHHRVEREDRRALLRRDQAVHVRLANRHGAANSSPQATVSASTGQKVDHTRSARARWCSPRRHDQRRRARRNRRRIRGAASPPKSARRRRSPPRGPRSRRPSGRRRARAGTAAARRSRRCRRRR